MTIQNPKGGLWGDLGSILPSQISNLLFWVKADAGTFQDTIFSSSASANNDPVGGWRDQSGNGNHAVQATAGKRPLLKRAIKNNLPALLVDGVDDIMTIGQVQPAGNFTMFMVMSVNTATAAFYSFLSKDDGSGSNLKWILGYDVGSYSGFQFHINDAGGGHAIFVNSNQHPLVNGQFVALVLTNAGNNYNFYKNGGAFGSGSMVVGLPAVLAATEIMANSADNAFVPAYFGEMGIYSKALSATEIANLFNYLNTRWKIY